MAHPSVETREFEGEQWVRKRDYDSLATQHTEYRRNTKSKLLAAVTSFQELVPDLNVSAEAAANWQLTRITGRSLSTPPAEVQLFRVEVPASSSDGGLQYKFLPMDAAALCSTHAVWSSLSAPNKMRVKKKVSGPLTSAFGCRLLPPPGARGLLHALGLVSRQECVAAAA